MRLPDPQESYMYGNPEKILEAKQAAEANRKKRLAEREAKKNKRSDAWQALEALFDPVPPTDENKL